MEYAEGSLIVIVSALSDFKIITEGYPAGGEDVHPKTIFKRGYDPAS